MSEFNSDVIDEERNVYTRPIVIRNNRTIFFLSPKGTIISFPHFSRRETEREKSEDYGVDASDGGYSGDGGRDTRRLTDAAL